MTMNRFLKHREDFPNLLDEMGLKTAVEVGVGAGLFASHLLRSKSLEMLTMVDIWETPYDLQFERQARQVAAAHPDRTRILKQPSMEVVQLFENGSVDFVYLDTEHTYEVMFNDAVAWWPKVRRGGILAGHDYALFNHVHPTRPATGIMLAAETFARKVEHLLFVTGISYLNYLERLRVATEAVHTPGSLWGHDVPSWYIFKREE